MSATSAATDSVTDVDWSSLPTTNVTLTDAGLSITAAGTYVLTGTTTGQVTVDTDGDVRIILSDATIASNTGAAIQVNNAELTVLELADGTTNTVSDAATRSDEEIDGAIYSSDDLYVTGSGTLNLTANFADGIVGKDDLTIASGIINVTSADDGIRGKDSLTITGGTITIDATGDGMKASNDTDLGSGQLTISGGDITISTGDDAIKAEQKIWISGGTINVTQSVESIEAPVIVIDDGDITINASDDGINASTSALITSGLSVTINGGTLTIVMGAGDTDAIDSNGDLTINGGTIDITAQSPFDYDGTGTLNGGTVTVNGEQVTQLTNQMMGGGMGGQAGGGMGGAPGAR
ncbi:carbohydrate-binding domain-containing protein [Brooklawnia sp.]|uniref:carbohydrate-binding domain-containing protein n=1 Tax=Brooklawnia sp. TaxID=2699740 RepID=UPI00311F2EE9